MDANCRIDLKGKLWHYDCMFSKRRRIHKMIIFVLFCCYTLSNLRDDKNENELTKKKSSSAIMDERLKSVNLNSYSFFGV